MHRSIPAGGPAASIGGCPAVETDVFRPPISNRSGKSRVLRNASHYSTSLVYAVVS